MSYTRGTKEIITDFPKKSIPIFKKSEYISLPIHFNML